MGNWTSVTPCIPCLENPEAEAKMSLKKGYTAMMSGKYRESIAHYRRYLELNPLDKLVWVNLGNTYLESVGLTPGKSGTGGFSPDKEELIREGIKCYEKARELEPNCEMTHYCLAGPYHSIGDAERSKGYFVLASHLSAVFGRGDWRGPY